LNFVYLFLKNTKNKEKTRRAVTCISSSRTEFEIQAICRCWEIVFTRKANFVVLFGKYRKSKKSNFLYFLENTGNQEKMRLAVIIHHMLFACKV